MLAVMHEMQTTFSHANQFSLVIGRTHFNHEDGEDEQTDAMKNQGWIDSMFLILCCSNIQYSVDTVLSSVGRQNETENHK